MGYFNISLWPLGKVPQYYNFYKTFIIEGHLVMLHQIQNKCL